MINIQNLACIELFVDLNDSAIPVKKDILLNKKIQSLFSYSSTDDTRISSPYRDTAVSSFNNLIDFNLYINLIDNKHNHFFHDLSFGKILLTTEQENNLLREFPINRIVDFENSFVNVKADVRHRRLFLLYFAYYTQKSIPYNDKIEGSVTVYIPLSADYQDFKLSDFIEHTLKNKKIKEIKVTSQSPVLMGYLDLVSKDKKRRIENIPLDFLTNYPPATFSFEPMEIDFENSYIRHRSLLPKRLDFFQLTFLY